jgi:CRISPR-associated protein Cas2
MAEDRMWFLVCYDIREPKRWRRIFRLLKGYGHSLQYSIFRCRLTRRTMSRLHWELEQLLEAEDSLFIAGLCSSCLAKIVVRSGAEADDGEWAREEPRFRIL